jgi:hypothetical protein
MMSAEREVRMRVAVFRVRQEDVVRVETGRARAGVLALARSPVVRDVEPHAVQVRAPVPP